LGLIDDDGCFYFNEKNKIRQFYVTYSFDQDWSHMINLFNEINVTQYEIRKVENKMVIKVLHKNYCKNNNIEYKKDS